MFSCYGELDYDVQAVAEPFYVLLSDVFSKFETSPNLLQSFRRMLPRCFAVKLRKCFVDYELWPEVASRRVRADNDWVNLSFNGCVNVTTATYYEFYDQIIWLFKRLIDRLY